MRKGLLSVLIVLLFLRTTILGQTNGDVFDESLLNLHKTQGWIYLGKTKQTFMLYKSDSIQVREQKTRVWVRVLIRWNEKQRIIKERNELMMDVEYMESLFEFDCYEKKLHMLTTIVYNGDGDVKDTVNSPNEWNYVSPDSLQSVLLNRVCIKAE
jgi:hypothetical protein